VHRRGVTDSLHTSGTKRHELLGIFSVVMNIMKVYPSFLDQEVAFNYFSRSLGEFREGMKIRHVYEINLLALFH
jgi:hypothetical protein